MFFAGLTAYLARKMKKIVYTFFCNKQSYYEKSALGEKVRNRKYADVVNDGILLRKKGRNYQIS